MITAFADDSIISGDVIACGVAIVQKDRIADAESILARSSEAVGIPAATPIHCRQLFAGDQRRGTPWEALGAEGAERLVQLVCEGMKSLSEQPIVMLANPRVAPPHETTEGQRQPWDEKAIASLLYTGAQQLLVSRYGADGFRMIGDRDPTKIPWVGTGRRQAHLTRGGFMHVGAGVEPSRLQPSVETPTPILMQLADIYAYTAAQAHSHGGGRKIAWFRKVYGLIAPERGVFEWNADPKWEDSSGIKREGST